MSITLLEYYAQRASAIRARAFAGIGSLDDWKRGREELRRQYLHSLGLERMPESTDPRMKEHGSSRGDGWTAKKVSFQVFPDCYGSGIVFYPDPLPARRNPAVLYLCGHSNFGILEYHPHALMWARRGYVCLIIDTIRQTDNTGEHSGFSRQGRDDWISMGYTSAGGEFLNSLGGLNVLCALPEVDPGPHRRHRSLRGRSPLLLPRRRRRARRGRCFELRRGEPVVHDQEPALQRQLRLHVLVQPLPAGHRGVRGPDRPAAPAPRPCEWRLPLHAW